METTTNLPAGLANRIDALFAEWDREDSPGCALAVYRDGEAVYARGYGMANLEHGVPIRPGSIFHVASISKQFTAACVAMLALAGDLDLDADVRRYAPEVPDFGRTITVRHLVHHTSGLRDMWDLLRLAGWRSDDLITEGDMLWATARQRAPNFAPGAQFLYSNTGYALLALIVRRVSGQTLRRFAHEHIFAPLGLASTHFHDDHTEIVPGRTQAYEPRHGGESRYKISIPVFDVVGTTSLFTTVEDMAKWYANFDHRRVGGDAMFGLTLQPGRLAEGTALDYAFGLRLRRHRGLGMIEHSGADAGYRAHFCRLLDHDLGVACLANLSTFRPRDLALRVLDACLDAWPPAAAPEPRPVEVAPAAEPADRAGLYRDATTGDLLRVTPTHEGLCLGFETLSRLVPLATGRYRVDDGSGEELSFAGQGTGVRIERGVLGGQTRVFERVESAEPSPEDLSALAGEYRCDELDVTYTLVVAEGEPGVTLRRRKYADRRLFPAGSARFATDNLRLEFDGDAAGFRLSTGRVRGLAFTHEGAESAE